MASQHPDNASPPSWANGEVIAGETEVDEAYLAYAQFGCHEVMWDSEGKDIDPHVIRKLLTKYGDFFRERRLGRDLFLTFRIPNPLIEVAERKVFLETLQAIPRHNDVARLFYQVDDPSVFEVILPFTSSHTDMVRVREVYMRSVVEPLASQVDFRGFTLKDLVGDVSPRDLEIIPLFEDMDSILRIDSIIGQYIELFSPVYVRVFIARSDPALTYGFISATLLAKLALSKCGLLTERYGIPIYPIVGAGCLPFRGHNSPLNVDKFMSEYAGVWTVTIQSAYRYDHPFETARGAIEKLNSALPRGEPLRIEGDLEVVVRNCIARVVRAYGESLEQVCNDVNNNTRLVPPRRARKLHIGLFSYSRRFRGAVLPRAIPFTAFFYTLGLPPEFIGARALKDLSEEEYDALRETHVNLVHDLSFAARFMSWENLNLMLEGSPSVREVFSVDFLEHFIPSYVEDVRVVEDVLGVRCGPRTLSDRKYANTAENFLISLIERDEEEAKRELERAARLRGSLG